MLLPLTVPSTANELVAHTRWASGEIEIPRNQPGQLGETVVSLRQNVVCLRFGGLAAFFVECSHLGKRDEANFDWQQFFV